MRIAVDCHMVAQPTAGDAGNARYAEQLVSALVTTAGPGDDVWALIAHPAATGRLAVGANHAGVPTADVPRLAWGAPRILATLAAQAAVFTYVAPLRAPCPVMLAVHDVSFLSHPEWLPARARTILRSLCPPAARRAGAVLALSQTAKAEIVAALRIPAERVVVVSPAPAEVFAVRPQAVERVAARFGLGRYVLAVGDLGPRKNLGALADAMRRLADPTLELALVGRAGPGAREILGQTRARWLGHVSDAELADLYGAATVTAFPSLHEGFGLPAVEAMACGSPLVASNRGALPEVVGDAGLVVAPTADGLADGLRAALEPSTSSRLREAGPARAAVYSSQAMGQAAWAAARQVHR
jgi:glycosyltransferase involved in cell wall biosynthesis